MEGRIDFTRTGAVGTLTINRPEKMNSITKEMAEQLHILAEEINRDRGIRVVILKGKGERSFSTGSDLRLFDRYGSSFELRNRQDYCDAVRRIRKPVVSLIRGYALGGGFELVLSTDIRIASDNALFAVSEVSRGWIPGSGLLQILSRNIGYHKAAELTFTARRVDAAEALEYGFINRVLPVSEIDAYVGKMALEMSEFSPLAMELAKEDLRASQNMSLEAGLRYERDLAAFSMCSRDSREGIAAFKEKRKPEFTGE